MYDQVRLAGGQFTETMASAVQNCRNGNSYLSWSICLRVATLIIINFSVGQGVCFVARGHLHLSKISDSALGAGAMLGVRHCMVHGVGGR